MARDQGKKEPDRRPLQRLAEVLDAMTDNEAVWLTA